MVPYHHLCGSTSSHFLALFALLVQSTGAISLSRDTISTIRSTKPYFMGYDNGDHFRLKKVHTKSCTSVGLVGLAQDEMRIYEAILEARKCNKTAKGSKYGGIVDEYIEDYKATSAALIRQKLLDDPTINKSEVVAGNLIANYRMLRRYRNYIQRDLLKALVSFSDSFSSCNNGKLQNLQPNISHGPFRQDFQLTMFAIIFTQYQYGWKPQDVADGRIKGLELGTTLKAVHCVELGVHAVASLYYPIGIEWLEVALAKLQNGDDTVDLKLTLVLLEKAKNEHDEQWEPLNIPSLIYAYYTAPLNSTSPSREWQKPVKFTGEDFNFTGDLGFESYWDICSGNLQKTEEEKSKLFCWLETKVHASWILGPLKAELLSPLPFEVYKFHHVLQDGAIQRIKNTMSNILSSPREPSKGRDYDAKHRHSLDLYIFEDTLRGLTDRTTGLKASTSDKIRVVPYTPGGHIKLHLDQNEYGEGFEGRIITLIFYFDDVEIGGETTIPPANVSVTPTKGSAILWYNLNKASEFDYKTQHGSCPVVQGQKWVASTWTIYKDQTHLTCDLDENAPMEYLVNGKSKYNHPL